MKKSSPRKNTKLETPSAVSEDTDFTALRQQIRSRVAKEALGMVESTIAGVNKGQYAALKYLFEAVGLFPANISDESQQQDVLAPSLLRALGIPEVPVSEHIVTKDSVKS